MHRWKTRRVNRQTTEPIVSIVMPTFNRMEFLPAAIESVLAQSLPRWELIVADDGSDRETLHYLASLTRDERVRLLRLSHSGNAGTARNFAIAAARAPLLAFLDSDDLWATNKLERQLAALHGKPECRWSYTAFVMVDASGAPLATERNRPWTPHSGNIFVQTVRTTASIRPSSVVASTELVRDAGSFDEAIDVSEDYDLWLRLALRSPVCVVDEPLIRVRRHASNPKRRPGSPHLARDYSLRKLAAQLGDAQRKLLDEERSRNALGLARAFAVHGERWHSIMTVYRSLPLGWKSARWWYGAVKELARACFFGRRGQARTGAAGH
jgi:glycosyltransferase involved in cell wall biosynthesis